MAVLEIRKCKLCNHEGYAVIDFCIKSSPLICRNCKSKQTRKTMHKHYGKPQYPKGYFNRHPKKKDQ